MGDPLRVDPAALSGAGSAVADLSSGLIAALSALTNAYDANTGQDAAGTAFGFAYQDSARALVESVAKGVNALRHIGYLIQGSATIYSRAEAAADIRGGASPLPEPVAPTEFTKPGGDPDVNGPGRTPPVLWYLVEFLVGDFWPNGEPNQLHAAAAAWNALVGPLYGVTGQNAGPYGVIDAQQMPCKEPMKTAVRDVGTALSSLAGEAQTIAGELSGFATEVERTQNAVRDLLRRLESVVGSIVDNGILGTVINLVTGDAEEKIHEVANDIKALIDRHKQQSAARKELLAGLVSGIKNYSRAMEIFMRVEMVQYLGEDAGRVTANVYDAVTDAGVGVTLGAVNTVGGLVTGFDPVGDPKGTWAMVEGLGKMALTFNPMTAPAAIAMDPQGTLDMVKNVTHFDDTFTRNRPFIGIGESLFDIGTAIVPGGAGVRAASGARVAEGAAARAEVGAAERAAGELGEIASATTGLRGLTRDVEGITSKLDDLERTGLGGGKPPSGSPGPLPKLPEPGIPPAGREPVPSSAPTGGKPVSAPPDAGLPPPVTHTAPAPEAEVPSAPAGSEVTSPASAAPDGAGHVPSAPSGGQLSALPTEAPGVDHPGVAPHGDGSLHDGGVGGDHNGGPPHNGDTHGGGPGGQQPNNPPHTGLYDPPANYGIPGEHLPDLAEIDNEFRLPNGAIDPRRMVEWATRVAEEYPLITKDGVLGIYNYTTDSFEAINPYLRNIDPLNANQEAILQAHSIVEMTDEQRLFWEARISQADEGLAALPPYRLDPSDLMSTTWRGMRGTDELLSRLNVGDVFHDPGYYSTTLDQSIADDFARGAEPGTTPTLMTVIGHDGVHVAPLSRFAHESEVLFPRNSSFEVLSRVMGDDGILKITVRQVPP
ncbi:MAG: ADP-ribosyltransferase [Mycobacterium sp.]